MARHSHVVRRAERAAKVPFPATPTLPHGAPCDGAAFVLGPDGREPDLRSLRDHLRRIWRGRLDQSAEAPEVVVALFAKPVAIEGRVPASALPLRLKPGGLLTSFAERDSSPATAPAPSGPARRLELLWGGRRYGLSLDALSLVSLAGLWDPPRLHVHRQTRSAAARTSGAATDLARISRAKVPASRTGEDLIKSADARLKALEDRTRLSSILSQLLQPGAGGSGPGSRGRSGAAKDGEPGVLQNLAGWLQWHSPFGNQLRARLGQRMNLVEKMIASNDIDGALRLAMSLASKGGDAARKLFPTGLPGMRATLDFAIERSSGVAPILGGRLFGDMWARYTQLAKQLEDKGDHRRAAYIRSKLLGDHLEAVKTLERGGAFLEAAKLSADSNQTPALTIRLLYMGGERDAALALARRTACFDELAEDSRGKDAGFHRAVLDAWTDMLAATGQHLRALQVTDLLAASKDADDALFERRRGWLVAGLEQAGGSADAELTVRAVLGAPWDGGADLQDFPEDAHFRGFGVFAQALERLQAAMRGEVEDAGRTLIETLHAFGRLAQPLRPEQEPFWREAAAPLFEAFARSLISAGSERLGQKELDAVRALLERAEAPVLAYDLGKITKLQRRPAPPVRIYRIPPASSVKPAIRRGCLLGTGDVLVWRESRLLQLLDRHGGLLWQTNLSDVTALVPVGSGPHVIVAQRQPDGASLLTRLATHTRTLHPIGRVKLAAAHDVTSETQWMVQIGGEIGALDLPKLCAPAPEIEFAWSCALTERLRALAFVHAPGTPRWLTLDVSPERAGVLELWTLANARELVARVCSYLPAPAHARRWALTPLAHQLQIRDAAGAPMPVEDWSLVAERKAARAFADAPEAPPPSPRQFQACDFERPFVRSVPSSEGVDRTLVARSSGGGEFVVEHATDLDLTCIARGTTGAVLFADRTGRLFMLEPNTGNVTLM
ncbi:hypothetical protein [Caulobacter sp. 17J65-9]|uniref:hypothetical protein n=1 Tax=Caulobacter sp. 17J65-9 TaxID=2709382 RepID=UPI0013C74A78|nr:hypothetical protein [Caulobacter sp. 17J65-9]NEX92579.1 hypothetical protein [Caulobacter sp. 17J65-9]